MNALQIGSSVLALGGVTLLVLAWLVGVRRMRSLVNGVDWTRLRDPDALLGRLGAVLFCGGMGFVAIGAAGMTGFVPEFVYAALTGAVGLGIGLGTLVVIGTAPVAAGARGEPPGR